MRSYKLYFQFVCFFDDVRMWCKFSCSKRYEEGFGRHGNVTTMALPNFFFLILSTGVDIEAATRAGIKVARIPSVNTGNALACAEHCIYMMLGLLRHQV